jgi:maleate cis-trans isomerase
MVTPYIPDVSQEMRNLLIENGFEISTLVSFEVSTEAIVARITQMRSNAQCAPQQSMGQMRFLYPARICEPWM